MYPGPTLSICIATRNRAQFLAETLDAICRSLNAQVEIVIVDGASIDNTAEVAFAFAKLNPGTHYIRELVNCGLDQGFDEALRHARGEYCWLMSDDDLVRPGAIDRVLCECVKGYSAIVVDAAVMSPDFSRSLFSKRLVFDGQREYAGNDLDGLFRDSGDHLSFIGALIVKRDVWLARDRQSYYGSMFVHVGVLFQAPLPSAVLVIGEPLVSIRYGNASWTGRAFEIWMFKWPALVWSFKGVSTATKNHICGREPWRSLKNLVLLRAKGAYSLAEYQQWIRPRSGIFVEGWKYWLVAVLPASLLNLLSILYLRLFGTAPDAALVDLMQSRYYFSNLFGANRRG